MMLKKFLSLKKECKNTNNFSTHKATIKFSRKLSEKKSGCINCP